jgi:signal peptidase II
VSVLVLLISVALAVYALDQLSKFLIVGSMTSGEAVPVLGELLQFRFVRNSGAAFSLGAGYTWIFSIVAAAVTVFIVLFARRIRSLGWATVFGLLLGGTVGNLTDRLFREPGFGTGHVIDFLQLYAFPAIFNVADIAVVSSMGLFILLTLRGVNLDGTRHTKPRADAAPAHPDEG